MGLVKHQTALDAGYGTGRVVMLNTLAYNAHDLEQELAWLAQIINARFGHYFRQREDDAGDFDIAHIIPPDLSESPSPYAHFLRHYQVTFGQRLAIILALAAQIRPRLMDVFFTKNKTFDRKFSEFGGVITQDGRFVPTGETLAFLLGENDLQTRFAVQLLFDNTHPFMRHHIFMIGTGENRSLLQAPLRLSEEVFHLFTTGTPRRPAYSANFPARHIETTLEWQDLVLHPTTRKQIAEIETWLQHGETLLYDWGMVDKVRPGYRTLFHGSPGTGKTVTACLLGQSTGRDVYKIDLSLVVSKYIGETEKNLAKVFDQAQNKGWILFFDEADALFGKRSETKDAHDRYANQEISYLLQRIESFDGVAILASNRRDDMDEAFARRFESVIYFPIPRPEERYQLWQQGFSPQSRLADDLDLERIAIDHELTGGAIMNVIRYASLQTLQRSSTVIFAEDIVQGIHREYAKEGKI